MSFLFLQPLDISFELFAVHLLDVLRGKLSAFFLDGCHIIRDFLSGMVDVVERRENRADATHLIGIKHRGKRHQINGLTLLQTGGEHLKNSAVEIRDKILRSDSL